MASNVVSIAVQGNSESLTRAFDKGATSADRFKAKMGLVAKAVVAALAFKAAQAITDFVGDSIEAFSDLNESLNAVEVTFGDAAEGIKDLGEESAQNLGLSNAEFNSFAVQMSAFAKEIAGDGGDVVGVVDQLSTRVSDFASVMNLEVADAAVKFQSGLAGETEPLRKFGIDVSAARVEMFALANGIIQTGEEMTEAQKIQARFGTIMEQTAQVQGDFANTAEDYANAQRIANAELEDAKALLGETIIPLATFGTEMQRSLVKMANEGAIALGELTEAFEGGEAALLSFENETGESAKTVSDAMRGVELSWQSWTKEIDIWDDALFGGTNRIDDMVGALEGLVDEQDLTAAGVRDLQGELDDLRDSGDLTEEQYEALAAVLDRELASAMTDAEQDARDFFAAQQDLGDETANTTDEIKTQADTLRAQTDPLFGAMKAAEDLEEAQRELNDAIVQYGEDSDEARDAARGVASANADLIGILEDLKSEGIDPTGQAARGMLEGMGIPPGVINSLFREFDRIESNFENRVLKLSVQAPGIEYQQRANRITPVNTSPTLLHEGGIVTEGLLDGNRSSRREAVVPLDTHEGKQALARAVAEAMEGIGGGGIHVTVHALDPHAAGEAVVRALEDWRRSNGDLPFSA